MTTNDIIRDTRIAHVRELKAEVSRLKEDLARTHEELVSLREHFSLALAAARDADTVPADGRLLIVDGWNAVIGTRRLDADGRKARRNRLLNTLRRRLADDPRLRAWAVFDGGEAGATTDGRLRVGYTGGTGAHRADRMICDYLRMMKYLGLKTPVTLVTDDRDFAREAHALGAEILGTETVNA